MSIASTLSQKIYTGNGSNLVFPTSFSFGANPDITVEVAPFGSAFATQLLGKDYTLTGAGAPEPGGTVTFVIGSVPPNNSAVRITRNTPLTQPISFAAQGEFLPETHEKAFDRTERQLQEAVRRISVLEAGVQPVIVEASKVVTEFDCDDPPEGSYPVVQACSGTPTGVQLIRVQDLTDSDAVQSAGLPDISAMVLGSFTIRNIPGLIPGHQYTLTWLVYTI